MQSNEQNLVSDFHKTCQEEKILEEQLNLMTQQDFTINKYLWCKYSPNTSSQTPNIKHRKYIKNEH